MRCGSVVVVAGESFTVLVVTTTLFRRGENLVVSQACVNNNDRNLFASIGHRQGFHREIIDKFAGRKNLLISILATCKLVLRVGRSKPLMPVHTDARQSGGDESFAKRVSPH